MNYFLNKMSKTLFVVERSIAIRWAWDLLLSNFNIHNMQTSITLLKFIKTITM